ncbi:MAG: AAA family ATPase [Treponema sp.]|jgi:hypothetical protein|nr:AAA family ATPase [Treponema sp.]
MDRIEIEQCYLGSLLHSEGKPETRLNVKDFQSPANAKIFRAIYDLWDNGVQPDLTTVFHELPGEASRIQELTNTVSSAANLVYYEDQILLASQKRNIETELDLFRSTIETSDNMALETNVNDLLLKLEKIKFAGTGKKPWQTGKTARQIMKADYPPLKWTVEGIIPEGLTKIDGAPKMGKSWFALHLATAVSCGGYFMGSEKIKQCKKVLYLALEDGERRIKDRLEKQGSISNDNLTFITATTWEGSLSSLKGYLTEFPETGLVIIDTLYKFCPMEDSNKYSETYRAVSAIQKIAIEKHISIVLIHHTRKGSGNRNGETSWADEGMGSQGINGAVDTIIQLRRPDGKPDGEMIIKGRDVEENCYNIAFNADICAWKITGKGNIIKERSMPPEQKRIYDLIVGAGEVGITASTIAGFLGKKQNTVLNTLKRLEDQNKVFKTGGRDGVYSCSPVHSCSQSE